LLSAAAYPDGFKVEFVPYSTTGAVLPEVELIVSQAKAVGIQLSINQLDLPGYTARLQATDYQGVSWSPQTTVPDFDPLMYPYFHSGTQSSNIGRVNDSVLDQLLDKQRTSLDMNVRVAAAHDIQRRIVSESYRLYEPSAGQFMLNPKAVKNFGPHFGFDLGGISENIWRDDVKS
jgi:ABC-type transport system substrate-binding protein